MRESKQFRDTAIWAVVVLTLGFGALAAWMIVVDKPWYSIPFFLMALSVKIRAGG